MIRRIRLTSATYEALVVALALPWRSKCQQRKVSNSSNMPLRYAVITFKMVVGSCTIRRIP
jgi:hypothetical protein